MLTYWAVRLASALLSIIPVRLSYALAGLVGEAYYFANPKHTHWAAFNLARVLNEPEDSPYVRKIARRSFGNYARVLVDFFRLPHVSQAEIMARGSVAGLDNLRVARERGKGTILITAHMGSWDRAGALLTGYGYAATVLVDTFSPPQLDAWVTRMRRKFRMQAVAVERPGALREMFRVLQRNEVLVLLIDRPDPRGIPVSFFGEETRWPGGVAQLVLRTDCSVVVTGLFRRPDGTSYDGFVEAATFPPRTGDADADARAVMRAIAARLERAIVAHPEQWYMFRPMWAAGEGE
jgi:lauroyl/myristoyl acyltransferase